MSGSQRLQNRFEKEYSIKFRSFIEMDGFNPSECLLRVEEVDSVNGLGRTVCKF